MLTHHTFETLYTALYHRVVHRCTVWQVHTQPCVLICNYCVVLSHHIHGTQYAVVCLRVVHNSKICSQEHTQSCALIDLRKYCVLLSHCMCPWKSTHNWVSALYTLFTCTYSALSTYLLCNCYWVFTNYVHGIQYTAMCLRVRAVHNSKICSQAPKCVHILINDVTV